MASVDWRNLPLRGAAAADAVGKCAAIPVETPYVQERWELVAYVNSTVADSGGPAGCALLGRVRPYYKIVKEGGGTEQVLIKDHAAGHHYSDDPSQDRGSHFNDRYGEHYDY